MGTGWGLRPVERRDGIPPARDGPVGAAPSGRWRHWRSGILRAAIFATFWTALFVMVFPGPQAFVLHANDVVAPPSRSSAQAPAAPSSGSAAGDYRLGPAIDAPALRAQLAREYPESGAAAAALSANFTLNYSSVNWQNPFNRPLPQLPSPTASAPADKSVGALSSGIQFGTVTGRVFDQTRHGCPNSVCWIQGVTITVTSVGGFCPVNLCTPATTDSNGNFTVKAPTGPDVITASRDQYLQNKTWVTVRTGINTYAGTIGLLHDGWATGKLVGDTSSHEAVSGVIITAASRDSLIIASPQAVSVQNGSFNVSIPPLPSRIDFQPSFVYMGNETFANTTPYQTVHLGTIYLERGVLVKANLIDSVTKRGISTMVASITGCSRQTSFCFTQGPGSSGPTVVGFTPPGPAYLIAQAVGYVENITPINDVPKLGPGKSPPTVSIYMVPEGAMQASSNLTWGNPSSSNWPTGMIVVQSCSLDGIKIGLPKLNPTTFLLNTTDGLCDTACLPSLGSSAVLAAPPLRDVVTFSPESTAVCNFFPTWPIPNSVPVWDNTSWVNITPDKVLETGTHDLTPGTYVDGKVYLAGTLTPPPNGFTVSACSTDEKALCGAAVLPTSDYSSGGFFLPPPPAGCTVTSVSFCSPAPPGPIRLTVTPSGGLPINYTWAYVTPGICCHKSESPLTFVKANANGFTSINITALGSIHGHLLTLDVNGTPTALASNGLPSIQVCPAGSPSPNIPCDYGTANLSGWFNMSAPLGWDWVTVSASLYQANSEWVNVTQYTDLGDFYLRPDAVFAGQVVTPTGVGIHLAQVKYCHVGSPLACSNVGATGLTGSSGLYDGVVPPGWLPFGSYIVTATAAGYQTNWTWANTTGSNITYVPTITLWPVGSGTGGFGPVHRAASAPGTSGGGAWVVGRVVDNITGLGLPGASVSACPVDGNPCVVFPDGTSSGGEFNGSVPAGNYWLYVNASRTDYYGLRAFVNATAQGFVDLGTLPMEPFAWVTGRVLIAPWTAMTQYLGNAALGEYGLGPGEAVVHACSQSGALCGPSATVNSGGFYNVSAPYGSYDRATISLVGSGPGSAPGGFIQNYTVFNATSYDTPLAGNTTFTVAIFGEIRGQLRDGSAWDSTHTKTLYPVRYGTASAITLGKCSSAAGTSTGGGGDYVLYLPACGNNRTEVTAFGSAFIQQTNITVGQLTSGVQIVTVAPLVLPHYGWAQMRVVDQGTGAPVPYATVGAITPDPRNASTISSGDAADGFGFLNLSVAPSGGGTVLFTASGPDYNTSTATGSVNESATTLLNGGTLHLAGTIPVPAYGWIQSAQVNDLAPPVATTVRDLVRQSPIALATVTLSNPAGLTGAPNVATNGYGQFLIDAPPSLKDSLIFRLTSYSANVSVLRVEPGARVALPVVNLTGDGIIAGRIVAFPSLVPVVGATVSACPRATAFCPSSATTNGSGYFWVDAPPGADTVTVSANDYVVNSSTVLDVCSDCWIWAGTIQVEQFATITGIVLGLPSGIPVAGANASTCSTFGFPTGPCGFSVLTDQNGSFELTTAPGNYIFAVNASGYNGSYLPLSVAPGERINLGTVPLQAYGALVGVVDSGATFTPIFNATVLACPTWSGGTCANYVRTDPLGHFAVSAPPGPYSLYVSANGYSDTYVAATVASGLTIALPPIFLAPIGTNVPIPVSGVVVEAANPSAPLAGAVVAATVNGSAAASTVTDAGGRFTLDVLYGTYALAVSADGYSTVTRTLAVHAAIAGLLIELPTMTYLLTGSVEDGFTHGPVSGVQIEEAGTILATSDLSGNYSVPLANGTYALTAVASTTATIPYGSVPFQVVVNGAPVRYDLSLYPPITALYGSVVNEFTGLPVVGAQVVIVGTTLDNLPLDLTFVTNGHGEFATSLPEGTYEARTVATGFAPTTVPFATNAGAQPLQVALTPTGPQASAGNGGAALPWMLPAIAVGIAVAALVLAALVASRRRPRAPPPTRARPATAAPSRGAPPRAR
jgi:hypothetical protein